MEKKETFYYEDCSLSKDKVVCIKKLSENVHDSRDQLMKLLGQESAKTIMAMGKEIHFDWTTEKEEEEVGKIMNAPYQFFGGRDAEIMGKELLRSLPEDIKKQLFDKGILP